MTFQLVLLARAAKRLLLVPPTLLGITLVTFVLLHLAPGDPASLRAGTGRGVTAQTVAENRRLLGLDQPLAARYASWLVRSARFDFGRSFSDGREVSQRVAAALPVTLGLGLLAALFAFGLAVPLGSLLAMREGRPLATLASALLGALYALPSLLVGMLLLRRGLPYGDVSLSGLAAPALCVALPSLATLSQQQRAALLAALSADYVRTARAKGAGEARVVIRHALRNSLGPLATLLGAQVPVLLSGSVVVEALFGLPGLGRLGYQAVLERDYPTLMALATLSALLTLAGVLLADLLHVLLDPRLRDEAAR